MSDINQLPFAPGPLNQLRAKRERGHYDRREIFEILDQAIVAHVGFVHDGRPMVIPMIFGHDGERLFLHGVRKGRIAATAEGAPVCITATLVDGIVVARSMFDASMNYRSVVIHGHAREIDDEGERLRALHRISDHVLPGRWNEVRAPFDKEVKGTSVLAVTIDAASAKIRKGPPKDDRVPGDERVWAGVLPVITSIGEAIVDPDVPADIPVPASVTALTRGSRL